MKKKITLFLALAAVLCCMFALAVNAECAEHTDYWTVTTGQGGYLGKIEAVNICPDCGKTLAFEEIDALFETLGYSYNENGGGITQHYAANRSAIARYEELTGERVRFGAVAATRNHVESNPLDENGNPISEKVKAVEFTDTKYDVFDVIVNGIPDEYKGTTEVICCAYIIAGGEITYIDNGVEKLNASAATFEAVTDKVDNNVEEAPSVNTYKIINGIKYKVLSVTDMGLVKYAYYNSDSNSNICTYDTSGTYFKYFATKKFLKSDLPNGTIINVAEGYMYRPEGWRDGVRQGSRPNPTTECVVVDDNWWGTYNNTKAFNISYSPTASKFDESVTLEDIAAVFQIYVPVSAVDDSTGIIIPPVGDVEKPFDPTEDKEKQSWDADGALKILAIGNSFSVDSMQYIYQVAEAAGVEKIVLGNLYIGGCTLATHLSNATNDSGAYTYYTNTNGTWETTGGYKISTAVKSDDWDFISFQQASGYSGIADSYDDLEALIKIVEPMNPSARLVWHMTWAYQQNSGHSDFSKYGKDQMTMYNAIVNAVKTKILTNGSIEIVIPVGTAIQNARTSYVGDTLTRDGYHLTEDFGRYIGSLAFVKALTGLSIDGISYKPSGVDASEALIAIEAVNNANKKPYEVTSSAYAEVPEEEELVLVEYLDWIAGGYWNSSDSSRHSERITDASNSPSFWVTRTFTRQQLPVGSKIVIASGWQYRPDAWVTFGVKNSNRPNNVTKQTVIIDEAWWGNFTVRGFNISKTSSVNIKEMTEADINAIFQIYVPQSALQYNQSPGGDSGETDTPEIPDTPVTDGTISSDKCVDEATVINGVEYRALKLDVLGLMEKTYYFSKESTGAVAGDEMSRRYFATVKFDESILINGAVIWIDNGWMYRPEGWVGESLTPESSRPAEVTDEYTTITDKWHGDFTVRAFNIAKQGKPFLDEEGIDTAEEVYEHFKIYIPVDKIEE
ncbi:MAG: DUF4886 domain-containing protein [Clostridia bacterium]|nr:DUF4886 domain-containing protein [Clostridia bacterium]